MTPDVLKTISLFENVELESLKKMATGFGPLKKYEAGQALMSPQENAGDVFFLIKGRVRLSLFAESGDVISYREIEPGDYFGWLSAIDGKTPSTAAMAITPVEVCCLAYAQFRTLVSAHPRVQENFMRRMAGVVRGYTRRIEELTFLPAQARIENELMRRFAGGQGPIALPGHEELASWIGTTRETVSRTLKKLEEEGVIEKRDNLYHPGKAASGRRNWLDT
jgi:CRP/FNR family cyclic AMP-dependent transcriptional regulator